MGQATINDDDEIVLEIGCGAVAYGGLSKALKGWGVTRVIRIPEGMEEDESSSEEGGGPVPILKSASEISAMN